jgi:hypothetical protein
MPTNFKISQVKGKPTPTGFYESKAEHKQEMQRIAKVEKELKHHESLGMDKAHKGSQKDAPLPNMRKY